MATIMPADWLEDDESKFMDLSITKNGNDRVVRLRIRDAAEGGALVELATTIVPNVLYRGVRLYPQNQGQHSPLVAFFTDCRDVAFLYAKYPPYAVYFRNFEHGTQVIDFTNVGNIQKIVDIANEAGLPDIFTDFAAIDNAANTSFEHDVFCLFFRNSYW